FPSPLPEGVQADFLGDLVICAPVVEREAREQGKSPRAHWAHIVIHGALHLCGHDHQNDAEAQRMEQLEIELLRSLRIANPYQSRHIESTP
ncbi:MAG TPA: rRNA maturation RNase YbeY, partial [Pseudomonadales bacterium]|nr:rRNA maturation RNase YbeY [Pseudomonadales bacterium]